MVEQVIAAAVDRAQLREQIQDKYCDVAERPEEGFHFHTGRPLAKMLSYEDADVDSLPESAVESFAGTGNPFLLGRLAEGETVVDIGCGAGIDTLLAAQQVGPSGRVIAIDMTDAMLEKARAGAAALGLQNVDARKGYAEELPVEDESVDVVISNGVINLAADKVRAISEIRRVLRPGGRLHLADVLLDVDLHEHERMDAHLWAA